MSPERSFEGDSARLLRAVRFSVSKKLKFDQQLDSYMTDEAEKLFQKNKDKENRTYRKEIKKMFDDTPNMAKYLFYLISYGLIPGQATWKYFSDLEKTRSKIEIT